MQAQSMGLVFFFYLITTRKRVNIALSLSLFFILFVNMFTRVFYENIHTRNFVHVDR